MNSNRSLIDLTITQPIRIKEKKRDTISKGTLEKIKRSNTVSGGIKSWKEATMEKEQTTRG